MLPEPGGEFAGYRIERELGRGAMGVVYGAADARGGRAALKVLAPPPLLAEPERSALEKRFLREVRALAAVRHRCVVQIYDAGQAEGLWFLAMEWLEGENVRDHLRRRGSLPPAEAVTLLRQLCEALEAVQAVGIVHRDVKPENMVLLADGSLRLTDFGVSWMSEETTITQTGGILGSPAYMAPEQLAGQRADRRSDVYAAAVTLHQLLAGELPFRGETLLELVHNIGYGAPEPLPAGVPAALRRVVQRGMERQPPARYADAREFGLALEQAARSTGLFPDRQPAPGSAPGVAPLAKTRFPDPAEAGPAGPGAGCFRHPSRAATGTCAACQRPVCGTCGRLVGGGVLCPVHRPLTLFGIPLVRMEVAIAALLFLLLLLCLSPWGHAWLQLGP